MWCDWVKCISRTGVAVFTLAAVLQVHGGDNNAQYHFDKLWPQLQQPWHFFRPGGVTTDANDNLFVADTSNNRIRKFTADGQYITQFGTLGTALGEFDQPRGLAVGPDISGEDRLFVADTNNNRIQVLSLSGEPIRAIPTRVNGNGATFPPTGVAVDDLGTVFITAGDNLRVQRISLLGNITEFVGDGTAEPGVEGCGTDRIPCGWPPGIAVDNDGHVFVADPVNFRIIRLSDRLQFQLAFGEAGQAPGTSGGSFFTAFGLDVAPNGNVIVTDSFNGRIQIFSNDGRFIRLFGEPGIQPGQLGTVEDVAVNSHGNIYVADTSNDRIQKFSPRGLLINQIGAVGNRDRTFAFPTDVAVDGNGNVYVTDTENHRIQRFGSNGRFGLNWGGEGRGAPGFFVRPQGIAIHPGTGRVYVADTDSSDAGSPPRFQIFEADGTYVGERDIPSVGGQAGVRDETVFPTGMAIDKDGNIFVVQTSFVNFIDPESNNNPVRHRVQRFDPEGGVITFGRFGDGAGEFGGPQDIAIDQSGDVYIADTSNHRIQKFSNTGTFITAWGGFGEHAGELNEPSGIAIGPDGRVYVADTLNNRIQIFTRLGGLVGTLGGPGDGPGQFLQPGGLDFGPDGALYVADTRHHRIQRFLPDGGGRQNKAIIIASGGDIPNNPAWNATQMLANMAHRTLIHQGFTKDRIHYLSADTDTDLDSNGGADDILPLTSAQVRETLTDWATDADHVFLYMTGLGQRDVFRLNREENLGDEALDDMLDRLQERIDGTLNVVYDASQSGSFIDALGDDEDGGRRVVCSTAADEPAFFVTGGTLSFSYTLLQDMFNGISLGQAVRNATDKIDRVLGYQTPQIDTDGDGIANGEDDEMPVAYELLQGTDSFDSRPVAGEVSPDMTLGEDENEAPFFVRDVMDADGNIVRAWCVVRWPTARKSTSNVVTEQRTFELEDQGNGDFEATYDELMPAGEYLVDVWVMDNNMNAEPVDRIVLVKAGAIIAGAIICQVTDASNDTPILDASVLRDPGNQDVTFNVDGIYTLTAVGEGQYDVTASAEGYLPDTQTINLASGELGQLLFALERDTNGGGGDGDKPEGTAASCSAATTGAGGVPWSGVLLAAGLLIVLLRPRDVAQAT